MNQCKGLEDSVKSLISRVEKLESELDSTRAVVNVLHQNVEGNRIILQFRPAKLYYYLTAR